MDVFFWAIAPRVVFWTRFEANFRLGGNRRPLFLNGLTSPRVPGQLPHSFIAHLNLSWMSPVKVRSTAVGGLKKMLVWNDLDKEEKIKIYNSGIAIQPETVREIIIPSYRIGDIYSPRIPDTE